MSQETKTICNIRYITDCDTELYQCGEVDGSFNQEDLESYLKTYGEEGKTRLLNHLAFLQYKVMKTWIDRKIDEVMAINCGGE
jgi:hypothetical protein